MATMAYPAYDAGAASAMSRRQSMTYGAPYPSTYSHPSYDVGPYPGTPGPIIPPAPLLRRISSQSAYDDHASYYPSNNRRYSSTPRPVVASMPRQRRHSAVSFTAARPMNGVMDRFRRPNSMRVKFKRKGSFLGGVGLGEAQGRGLRLANGEAYFLSDLHPDRRDTIFLKMGWSGHGDWMYNIPLDSYDGRLDLETLARRVARSCVHYFQANRIPISWDRLDLKALQELEFGVWEPLLSVN